MTHSAYALLPTSSRPLYKMTTLENATSRSAERVSSASSPETAAYGDQPTTSSVNRSARSTDPPATSASIAFDNTSFRDSLIKVPSSCRKRSVQQLLKPDGCSGPQHLRLR